VLQKNADKPEISLLMHCQSYVEDCLPPLEWQLPFQKPVCA